MLRSQRKKSIEDLLVEALRSQSRMNDALVDDIELLRARLIAVEDYLKIVEARREAELKKKGNKNG